MLSHISHLHAEIASLNIQLKFLPAQTISMSDENLEGESRRKPYAWSALFRSEYLGNQSIFMLEELACFTKQKVDKTWA